MNTIRNFALGILVSAAAFSITYAQSERPEARPTAAAVTVSVSTGGVRFAALGGVKQMRLEVYDAGGELAYSSDFLPGNVRDWKLDDRQGQRLPDGTFTCVITFRDLTGRLGVRQGSLLIQGGKPLLQMSDAADYLVEPDRALSPASNDASADAVTLTAHDGRDGELVTTRGALTFRSGDFFAGRDRELMRLTPDGRVGIGTDKPEATLDVAGTIRARGGIKFDDGTVLNSASASGAKASASLAAGRVGTDNATGVGTNGRLAKWTDNAGTLGDSALTESNGNLGLGTNAPFGRLHIKAAGGFGAENADGTSQASAVPLLIQADRTVLGFLNGSGRQAFAINLDNNAGTTNARGVVTFYDKYDGQWHASMTLKNGNVGVGTGTPAARLDIAGDLKVSGDAVVNGNIAAKYQDVAEWVDASEEMRPGTVVTLDPTRVNTVKPSGRAYDTRVAGVVSAQPGLILGQGGEGKVLVATTGRVKVKVDATRRPVRVGDLLVTSGRPGVAMRSVPVATGSARMHRPGTIVGKALEPLSGGEGYILVLLSLQ